LVRAVNRRIVSGDASDEPTRVAAGDAMATLVHAALLELLTRVPRRAAAAALQIIAAAIADGTEDLRGGACSPRSTTPSTATPSSETAHRGVRILNLGEGCGGVASLQKAGRRLSPPDFWFFSG
jgi:hypothetical protein